MATPADRRMPSGGWVKLWSGKGSLVFDSNLAEWYTRVPFFAGEPAYSRVVFFYHSGITDCWVPAADKDDVGERLASSARVDAEYVNRICAELKTNATRVNAFIDSHTNAALTSKTYAEFWELVREYYLRHISVKYVGDYLSAAEQEKYLPILEDARLFCDPVYRNIEAFVQLMASQIAATQPAYAVNSLLAATHAEFRKCLQGKKLANANELQDRFVRSALAVSADHTRVLVGGDVKVLEELVHPPHSIDSLTGTPAFGGVVTGRVRIVLDPTRAASFVKGDILVTGMTRPDFEALFVKAGGVVTDSGGILSHAAILAREHKKPCVMATKNATKALHDGDLVEVDADTGVVRVLERKKAK